MAFTVQLLFVLYTSFTYRVSVTIQLTWSERKAWICLNIHKINKGIELAD